MKAVRLSLLLLFLSVQVLGQTARDYARDWDLGRLCKEDFAVSAREDSSYFSVLWIKDHARVKKGSVIYRYLDIRNAFLPGGSVVGKEGLTEDQMLLFQREFDLSEQYARKLRDTLLLMPSHLRKKVWNQKVSEYYSEGKVRAAQMDADFYPGPDRFDITAVPMRRSPIGVSVFLGADCSIPFGAMEDLSGPLAGFSSGLDLRFGRFFLTADLSLRQGEFKGDYFGVEGVGSKGSSVRQFLWRTGPGLVLVGDEDWRLSAFATVGKCRTGFSPDPVSGWMLSEGLRLECNLQKVCRLDAFRPLMVRTNLFTRMYMDQVWIAGNGSFSPSVNLSIGFDILMNGLSRD